VFATQAGTIYLFLFILDNFRRRVLGVLAVRGAIVDVPLISGAGTMVNQRSDGGDWGSGKRVAN
jgi:transposase InsO family protein